MKSREEYEKIAKNIHLLSGEAQASRIHLDVLLDIRELLIKAEQREILKEITAARIPVTFNRLRRTG